MKKEKKPYHHGNLAESLLEAVEELATQFGLEAVTLRACAKLVGVSPSSAFRHYADKRSLLTAFATRALNQLTDTLNAAHANAPAQDAERFISVGLAYVEFALDNPAYFRAMWRDEIIYCEDKHYVVAAHRLSNQLQGGFANTIDDRDPDGLSAEELLAWSAVHGLAGLLIDGPVGKKGSKSQNLQTAESMIKTMMPVYFN